MADYVVSHITMRDGKTIELKDAVARAAIAGGTYFLGITETALVDGSSTNPITVDGESVIAANGNQVIYNNKEFVYIAKDERWHELGDLTGLTMLVLTTSIEGENLILGWTPGVIS